MLRRGAGVDHDRMGGFRANTVPLKLDCARAEKWVFERASQPEQKVRIKLYFAVEILQRCRVAARTNKTKQRPDIKITWRRSLKVGPAHFDNRFAPGRVKVDPDLINVTEHLTPPQGCLPAIYVVFAPKERHTSDQCRNEG